MRPLAISKTTYRVSDFLSWQRAGTLTLSPSFQRRQVWLPAAKSYLLDTVARGLPIPIIFLRERTDLRTLEPQREVVDGQQRLRTIIGFIAPGTLSDFRKDRDSFVVSAAHNKELAGKEFPDLSEEVRRRILDYELSVHVLPPGTDDREVLEIFARLNSTGVRLNGQELRNARFFGELKQTAYELAYEQLTRWRQWAVFRETDIARMDEVELVSDLMLLMFYGVRGKTQAALDALYRDKDSAFPERDEVRHRFRAVMDAIDDTAGRQLHALEFSNVTLFHTLYTFCYDVMYGLRSPLEPRTPARLPPHLLSCLLKASQLIETQEFTPDVAKALRGRTTHAQSRLVRLDFLRQVCAGDAP